MSHGDALLNGQPPRPDGDAEHVSNPGDDDVPTKSEPRSSEPPNPSPSWGVMRPHVKAPFDVPTLDPQRGVWFVRSASKGPRTERDVCASSGQSSRGIWTFEDDFRAAMRDTPAGVNVPMGLTAVEERRICHG
jgi:hypothetical protein